MANTKLSALTELTSVASGDLVYIVDVSDTTDGANGTSKKITKSNLVSGLTLADLSDVTASAAEVNILDGVTSTAAELNILDGVTSTAAELNILDGATLTVTELNYVDGVTSAIQTQLNAKEALGVVTLDATPSADHSATGAFMTLTANETQAFGDVCYINSSGEAQLADADGIATAKVVAMCTTAVAADAQTSYLTYGVARDDTWNWTVGGYVYLSTTGSTGNTLTQTAPSGADDCIVIVGIALHADRLFFNPQLVIVEHTG